MEFLQGRGALRPTAKRPRFLADLTITFVPQRNLAIADAC
jgi:hypothetical protein